MRGASDRTGIYPGEGLTNHASEALETSDFLASSIQVNPVIIRKLLSKLKNAGLIEVARGTGGTSFIRPIGEISFYDVYLAVDLLEDGDLFHFHENPNPACPVGRNIHTVMDSKLSGIQKAMEKELKKYTIADIVGELRQLFTENNPS